MENEPPALPAQKENASFSNWRNIISGIAAVTKLITGPLFALGGGTMIASLHAAAETAAILSPIAAGLLALGAVSLVGALVTTYINSSLERATADERDTRKAVLAARYLVKELKANNMCMTTEKQDVPEPECHCKDTHKNWASAVASPEADAASPGRLA